MKNIVIFSRVLFLSVLFVMFSCSSSSDDGNNGAGGGNGGGGNNIGVQVQQIQAIMQQGTWRVAFYFDDPQEETNDYRNFGFTFNQQGSVAASDGIDTHNGTWLVSGNSNNDGVEFNLTFSSPPDYEELSDDWDVEAYTETRIEMQSVSGGSGGTDVLIFEKI